MIFNTFWFLMFFIIIYPIYLFIPSNQFRLYFLLAASAVFHTHFAGPAGVLPVIVMGIATYFFALLIDAQNQKEHPSQHILRWSRFFALSIPIFGLIYYKYRYFIFENILWLPFEQLKSLESSFVIKAMPLAISFFAFEFVHYLVDVIKGHRPIKNIFHFSLFTIFFPSIVSGPIKRFQNFIPQISNGIKSPKLQEIIFGSAQVLLGFSKKIIVADNAYLFVQLLEKQVKWNFYSVSLLMLLLAIRILFDFSGYSDIAIGIARMLGIHLPVNFNFPYIAKNISDFWNRWHISLSSWIRDYLYIPLGGNHGSIWSKFFNLFVVMALCGLWHGASMNFLFWGIYHGLGLGIHTLYKKACQQPDHIAARFPLPAIIAWSITFIFVCYGWLLFFYPFPEVVKLTNSLFII
jgi:alginate O-acetyltransferase complex protein AlgI